MIPVKLTIEGLYSYRESQTIDFTHLTNAGLFGIFGGVGSGKSSILEAISFAVYGETERLNNRENRNYNMMNLKSNRLLIDFEFKGNDENLYRFTVSGRRNTKNYDDVKTFDRSAYKRVHDDWEPINVSDAESITGLNYTNFKRTIIIPQGRFQEFLQLKETERVSMLKELFNLQKYDLSFKIAALEKKNSEALNTVNGQLLEVGEVAPEVLEAKEKELFDLNKLLFAKKKELEQNIQLEKEQQSIFSITSSIKLESKKLQDLQAIEKEIAELEKEIKEFESLLFTFKADFDRLGRLEKGLDLKRIDLKKTEENKMELESSKNQLSDKLFVLQPNYDKNSFLATEAEELNKLADKKDIETSIQNLKARTIDGKAFMADVEMKLKLGKESAQIYTDDLTELKKQLPDIQILNAVQAWFVESQRLNKSIFDIQNRINATLESTEKIKKTAIDLCQQSVDFEGLTVFVSFDVLEAKILSLIERLREEDKLINSEISKLTVQHQLEQYALALHDGSPCPLCGSEHHPHKLNVGEVNIQLENLNRKKNKLDLQLNSIQNIEKSLIRLKSDLQNSEKQTGTEIALLELEKQKLNHHNELFVWTGFEASKPELIQLAIEKYQTVDKSIKAKEIELQKLIKDNEKNQLDKEKADKTLREFENQLNGLNAKVELFKSQIKNIELAEFDAKLPEDLRKISNEKLQLQKEIISQFNETNEALQKSQQQLSGIIGKLDELKTSFKELSDEKSDLDNVITDKLLKSGSLTKEFVLSILNKNLKPELEKEKIATYHKNVSELKGHISGLEKQLDNKQYNEVNHAEIKTKIADLNQFVESESKNSGALANEINRFKKAQEQSKKLKAESEKLTLRAQDILELKRLFKGNGFVNFVSTAHLENLCRAANDRLMKLTRQKLGIEITANNEFTIRDYMNEGKLRSVKTLSGGQTFQASLSLALALADSIHRMSGSKENFFFLDEGFGSLDKDTLAVIFESLKALRKENRIVGFISHVEEMQQQIETYIQVVNNEDRGSIVTKNY